MHTCSSNWHINFTFNWTSTVQSILSWGARDIEHIYVWTPAVKWIWKLCSGLPAFCSPLLLCLQLLAHGGEFLPFEAPRSTSRSPPRHGESGLWRAGGREAAAFSKCLMSVHFPILIGLSKCIPGLSIPAGVPDKNDLSAAFSDTLSLSPRRMRVCEMSGLM